MSTTTEKLGLFKYDPVADGAQTFNIKQALNDNWDRIEKYASETDLTLANHEKRIQRLEDAVMATLMVPSQSGTLTYNGSAQSPNWENYDHRKMAISGNTSGTDAGAYTVTFSLLDTDLWTWDDGTITDKTVTWTIGRATISVPTQSGSLTYTGSAQSPQWNNYDSSKMTLGGTVSGTDAGSYNAAFTPTSNYQFPGGVTGAQSAPWTIAKAAGYASISPTSLELTTSVPSGVITVNRLGDGAITAVSSNTAAATVSVSGDQVTVTGQANGSAVITVKVAEGTNYTAPADLTCAVTVSFVPALSEATWAQISELSSAGTAANYWAVGDTKTITINGKVGNTTFSNLSVDAFILGFNHNSNREGANRIHFKIGKINGAHIALCDSNYGSSGSSASYFQMNASNTNSGGWNGSSMRNTLLGNSGTPTSPPSGSLLAALPSDLRAVMKAVTKYSDNTGKGKGYPGYVTSTIDYLFLLSEFEYHGARTYANSAEQNYQAQYDYYKAGNSKIHYKHNATGTAAYAWCRSVYSDNSDSFCRVNTGGSAGSGNATHSRGVAPGFCV